jgi:hypothetical protein
MITSCKRTQTSLSRYLDGLMTGREMQKVTHHLSGCPRCNRRLQMLQQTQAAVASLGRKVAPPELALRLRLALSREAARTPARRWESLKLQLEHVTSVFMVPATAGVFSAIILFAVLMGFFTLPAQLQAANELGMPFSIYTPPEVADMPWHLAQSGGDGSSITLEAAVDANGRINDYRILSSSEGDLQDLPWDLKNLLVFAQFRPATSYGRPIPGRVVLSFSKINVKG